MGYGQIGMQMLGINLETEVVLTVKCQYFKPI